MSILNVNYGSTSGGNAATRKKGNGYSWGGGGNASFSPASLNSMIGGDIANAYSQGPGKEFKANNGLLFAGLGNKTKQGLTAWGDAATQNAGGVQAAFDTNQGFLTDNGPGIAEQNLLSWADGSNVGANNADFNRLLERASNDTYADVMASFGGSGGVGSGLQTRALTEALGDVNAGMRLQQRENDLARQFSAVGLIGNEQQQTRNNQNAAIDRTAGLYSATQMPGQVQTQIGQIYDQNKQGKLDAKYEKYLRNQDPEYQHIAKYLQLAGGQAQGAQPEQQPGLFDWLGAGVSLAGAAAPYLLSDERAKENIKHVGKTKDGQKVYSYTYKDDPAQKTHMGLMAQEVAKKKPEAVGILSNGFMAVDYSKALEAA